MPLQPAYDGAWWMAMAALCVCGAQGDPQVLLGESRRVAGRRHAATPRDNTDGRFARRCTLGQVGGCLHWVCTHAPRDAQPAVLEAWVR